MTWRCERWPQIAVDFSIILDFFCFRIEQVKFYFLLKSKIQFSLKCSQCCCISVTQTHFSIFLIFSRCLKYFEVYSFFFQFFKQFFGFWEEIQVLENLLISGNFRQEDDRPNWPIRWFLVFDFLLFSLSIKGEILSTSQQLKNNKIQKFYPTNSKKISTQQKKTPEHTPPATFAFYFRWENFAPANDDVTYIFKKENSLALFFWKFI